MSFCGAPPCAIITVFVEDGIDPNSILDKNNKNKSLRDRTLVGVDLLREFQINSQEQKTFKGGRMLTFFLQRRGMATSRD